MKLVTATHLDFVNVAVKTPKDDAIRAQMKAVPGICWNPQKRRWEGPEDAVEIALTTLESAGVVKVEWTPKTKLLPLDLSGTCEYPAFLREYQREGWGWCTYHLAKTGAAILADEMGLGKTPQAIATAETLHSGQNIVVCPAVVRPHWQEQIRKFARYPENWKVYSYEGFVKASKKGELHPEAQMLVIDEAHYVSNPKTQRSKAIREFRTRCEWCLALTGTPMTTTPKKLHNLLDILWPGRWGKPFQFQKRYCNGHFKMVEEIGQEVWDADGVSREEELATRLSRCMLRRTKLQVGAEIPPITWQTLEIPLPKNDARLLRQLNREVSNKDWHSFQTMLSNAEAFKVPTAVCLAREVVSSGGRPLLLTTRQATAERLAEELGVPFVHGGSHAPEKRKAALEECEMAVATLYSINTGIDLVNFDTVIVVGFDKVPSTLQQAVGRVHRIGQRMPVQVHCLVALGTVDEVVKKTVLERIDTFEIVTGSVEEGGIKALGRNDDDVLAEMGRMFAEGEW